MINTLNFLVRKEFTETFKSYCLKEIIDPL